MSVAHWESYYRSGRLAACPTGFDNNYTLELRDIWTEFFGEVASGAAILDIGTGNGALPLIARQTAETLGRDFEIHGVDLAQINPSRDVINGKELFSGITFHAGVAAETLPFETGRFAAVSGQYAIEYSDTQKSMGEIFRVLRAGSNAQFVTHHANSIVVERAATSRRHADLVLINTKVMRKLRVFLNATQRSQVAARSAWTELESARSILNASGRRDLDRRVIDVIEDALPKLLAQRHTKSRAALDREIDLVENDLRDSVHRLNDLIAVAWTETAMSNFARYAQSLGFVKIAYQPINHAKHALVGWRVHLTKPK